MYKMLSKIKLSRFNAHADEINVKHQFGFRHNR